MEVDHELVEVDEFDALYVCSNETWENGNSPPFSFQPPPTLLPVSLGVLPPHCTIETCTRILTHMD